jgi:uncharacterized membrane protein YhaH (DUF805 family)
MPFSRLWQRRGLILLSLSCFIKLICFENLQCTNDYDNDDDDDDGDDDDDNNNIIKIIIITM